MAGSVGRDRSVGRCHGLAGCPVPAVHAYAGHKHCCPAASRAARLPLLRMIVAQVAALAEPAQTGQLRARTVLAQVCDRQDDPDRAASGEFHHVPARRGVGIANDNGQMRDRTAPLRVDAATLALALARRGSPCQDDLSQDGPVGRIGTRTTGR